MPDRIRAAVLTVSDRCSRGEAEDRTGPLLREALMGLGAEIVACLLVPDDADAICREIVRLSDEVRADVIVTAGGTGVGPRDLTPEATETVLERRAPGIAEAIRAGSLEHTPTAMLSRGTAGVRGTTLIVNLPGSPRGAKECLGIVSPVLVHAVAMMAGRGHAPPPPEEGAESRS
jgi:molybdenum cofactor synthesis domain-containing protein